MRKPLKTCNRPDDEALWHGPHLHRSTDEHLSSSSAPSCISHMCPQISPLFNEQRGNQQEVTPGLLINSAAVLIGVIKGQRTLPET